MPRDDGQFLRDLDIEAEAELSMAESSRPEEEFDVSPADWQFDPTDVVRDEVTLRGLLGAVESLESEARFGRPSDDGTGAS